MYCIKKSVLLFLLIVSFFLVSACFVSCTKKTSPALREAQTLREASDLLKNHTEWADELSSTELSSSELNSLKKIESYQSFVRLSPLTFIASTAIIEQKKIYPHLKGFASLNIEPYSVEQIELIDSFCSAIIKDKNADSFIKQGKLYTLVLFKYNMQNDKIGSKGFESYIKGEPFMQDDLCQCPVRFLQKDGNFVDIFLYLSQTQAGWKIEQIAYKEKESV